LSSTPVVILHAVTANVNNIHNSQVIKFHSAGESSMALTYLRQILTIWLVGNDFASSLWGSALFTSSMRYLPYLRHPWGIWLADWRGILSHWFNSFVSSSWGSALFVHYLKFWLVKKDQILSSHWLIFFASSDSIGKFIHRKD
jgi:hypothetical protein